MNRLDAARMGVAFSMQILRHEVRDDRFIRIIEDFARLVVSSEDACARAMESGRDDFADAVISTETDYLEDLIGAIFLMLQTKIRRVGVAACETSEALTAGHGAAKRWPDARAVRAESGNYKNTGHPLIELVWAVGNYFKHQDEWAHDVWTPQGNSRDVKTRKMVEAVGIVESSTGNMRTALAFLGVDPHSCGKLAQDVQNWADEILRSAEAVQFKASRQAQESAGSTAGGSTV
ncbi:hypothetical protein GXW78_06105 [Roseomonas terrae]|uniref:Uncharacterized protein n=1 Tax=Neoroseomonas terrae TaxID=424799 RepID=A0ABS5EEY4_9PROT|nr:hypothetical protein [Neoroseomonas terrae]MBR0649227.1 hypothetical protein [Neoroseomonas terrae]